MSAVHTISPEHRKLVAPTRMRQLAGWLCWRYEQHEGEPKPRKVPFYPTGGRRHGKQGTPEDRAKLTTFAAARDAAARMGMDGVGFALLPDWGITALDFDDCVAPDGTLPPEITEIASRTYTEYSPSGHGVRAFVIGNYGDRKQRTTAENYGFEVFSTRGFTTFTGNVLDLCEMFDAQDAITDLDDVVAPICEARFGTSKADTFDPDDFMAGLEPVLGLSISRMEELLSHLDADLSRDEWIRVGMALHHECEGDDTGFELWNDWSENGGKYPGREALEQQWESFQRRAGERRKQVTMATVVRMVNEAIGGISPERLEEAKAEGERQAGPAGAVSTPINFDGKFKLVGASSLARRPPPDWWIKGVLPKADLAAVYGASGSGKTFLVLDLLLSVARGLPWRGRRVAKGRVLYVAAEGGAGVGKRFAAYCQHHGVDIDTLEVSVLVAPPNIMDSEDITELVKSVAAAGGFDIIVLDTYAQVTPGANENAADDMGRALANCRALRDATGAMILLVHHSGKDESKGARGWSGLRAALDCEIHVGKHESGKREVTLTKLKDGEDGVKWGLALDTITLGMDADGDEITSCVAVETELPAREPSEEEGGRRNVRRLGKVERHVVEMIEAAYPGIPTENYYLFVDACVNALPEPAEGQRDTRRFTVNRAIQQLAKRKDENYLAVEGGRVVFLI